MKTSKLTAQQVLEIRSQHRNGAVIKDIARAYGVNPRTVDFIVTRRNWAWLEDEGEVA